MEDFDGLDILSVSTTVGSVDAAKALARLILEHRLAACVQVEALLASHYRWEGALCDEPEVRLVVKTLPERQAALQALFDEYHPYQLPQFLAVRMQASKAYAAWVRASVEAPAA